MDGNHLKTLIEQDSVSVRSFHHAWNMEKIEKGRQKKGTLILSTSESISIVAYHWCNRHHHSNSGKIIC